MRKKSGLCLLSLLVALALPAILSAGAQASVAPAPYTEQCAGCHGRTLQGAFGPALSGDAFRKKWAGKVASLRAYIAKSMPPGQAGVLNGAQYDQVTRYIADVNKLGSLAADDAAPPPQAPAEAEAAVSEGNVAGGQFGEADFDDDGFKAEMERRRKLLASLSEVTDAELLAPAPSDWLQWRRTYDAQGFSPLAGINRKNVISLGMRWSLALPQGTNQIAPLVHEGVIFANSAGTVMAIEADTGTVLWQYSRPAKVKPLGPPVTNPRSMALYGHSLFVPTVDNHMLALDFRTGELLWDHHVEGPGEMLRMTAGPVVVHGKVIQGISGCAGSYVPGGCFIVALDSRTGKELWRFNTIAPPGSPDDSWNSAPLDERVGGSVWTTGSYDQSTGLVYLGTGQTYRIKPLMEKSAAGQRDEALYTNTTLALEPDSGKLVWHYQHMARELWDLDWSFERTLATIPVDGKPRRVVMTMGKIGVLDVLDARTGDYLFSRDLGLQDLVTDIDPKTGRKTIRAGAEPIANEAVPICPFPSGIRNFPATSYDERSGTLYIPGTESCMNYMWRPQEADWDIAYQMLPRPDSDGKFGRVDAMDVRGKANGWNVRRRAGLSSAVVATQGGLLFEGALDRYFRALDSSSGKELWSARLPDVPNAFPVSYAVGGKQCIVITTGGGGPTDATYSAFTPENKRTASATIMFAFCER
ncbi:PQQ-binding-like beta-propeller repeat protein [Tsuneonella sp. CC-YZS046]|uniref:outer membrane protein assembly factor BamB family protein n=1 Tax=Tsuneonella sp. CC-YZS046 TaxID=3042152 RepID=UPI002D789460|nr:PQQ-binding-like beta-propeller repeat protein [Tsuneonella sp. CC-YZS046]WRO66997.1 PQQ-binding-like beta-propeller repeat protein [Tsuneonella sp. CC-YZS046]